MEYSNIEHRLRLLKLRLNAHGDVKVVEINDDGILTIEIAKRHQSSAFDVGYIIGEMFPDFNGQHPTLFIPKIKVKFL